MFKQIIILFVFKSTTGHPKNLAWSGGPLHMDCETGTSFFIGNGKHISDNVIAIKAASFRDELFVITPRLKPGVLATVWQIVRGRQGTELQPYPQLQTHTIADCNAIQNAVDFHLDYLGNLWILDTGIINTLESAQCTCRPKVVVISIILHKVTKVIDLSLVTEPDSLLQNIVVEYGVIGKPFVYITDASRGAILVHDASTGTEWSVLACLPAPGLQIALGKRGPTHALLVAVRMQHPGLYEVDTAVLRRRNTASPIRVFGEHNKPVYLLGSDPHHIYLRISDSTEVLSWDTRRSFNTTNLLSVHSPGPRMTPTSVTADPLKHTILVLESNYGEVVNSNVPAYHRITFIGQL